MTDATADISTNKGGRPSTFFRSFIDHPASVDETYWQHSKFALRFAGKLILAGAAALVHAFIPALFETTASRMVSALHLELSGRHAADTANSDIGDTGAG